MTFQLLNACAKRLRVQATHIKYLKTSILLQGLLQLQVTKTPYTNLMWYLAFNSLGNFPPLYGPHLYRLIALFNG